MIAGGIDGWLDAVMRGQAVMSQRGMAWVDAHGGLHKIVSAAKARGVHLLQLTADDGKELLVASLYPFRTLC